MRSVLFCVPFYLVPLLVCIVPMLLVFLRRQLLSAWLYGCLVFPLVAWSVPQLFISRHGSLSNAALEPALVGLVTGLIQVPQIVFAGQVRAEATHRFWTGLVLSILFGVLVATSFPVLPE
jgi:hypothetical protein